MALVISKSSHPEDLTGGGTIAPGEERNIDTSPAREQDLIARGLLVVKDGTLAPPNVTVPAKGNHRGAWQASTVYKQFDIVERPSDSALVYANADFTSGGSYSAGNWTVLSAGGGSALKYPDGTTPATQVPRQVVFDVLDYGAKFDSTVTDDTVAIQAALDAASLTLYGSTGNDKVARIVQMPPGRAKIQGSLVVPANVWLRGHGPSGTYLVRSAGGSATAVVTVGSNTLQQSLSDFGVINNDTGVDCIDLSGAGGGSILGDARIVVRDVVCVGGRDGVTFQSGNGNECRFTRVTSQRAARHGFWLTSTDCFLTDCTAAASGQGDTQAAAQGFRIQGGNSRIHGSKAYGQRGTSGFGFSLLGGGRHEVAACEAQDCQGGGFNSVGQVITLVGCTADSVSQYGFDIDGTGIVDGCTAVNRSGGLFTMLAAIKQNGGIVKSFRTNNCIRLAKFSGAAQSWYNTGCLDIDNRFGCQQVAYAASITPDPWAGQDVYMAALTGVITIANPASTNEGFFPAGMRLCFQLTQDATGGRTVTWGAAYKLDGGTAVPTTLNTTTRITFVYDGTNWREEARTLTT